MGTLKYVAFLSFDHHTGTAILNEYWLCNRKVVDQRTTDAETGNRLIS